MQACVPGHMSRGQRATPCIPATFMGVLRHQAFMRFLSNHLTYVISAPPPPPLSFPLPLN